MYLWRLVYSIAEQEGNVPVSYLNTSRLCISVGLGIGNSHLWINRAIMGCIAVKCGMDNVLLTEGSTISSVMLKI